MEKQESKLDQDNLRIEIAILQEPIDAFYPNTGKFRIPALMTEDNVSKINTNNANIANRRNGNIGSSSVNIDNYIELKVPFECTYTYGDYEIPAETKFLVALVAGNDNDIRIIARYTDPLPGWREFLTYWLRDNLGIIKLEERMDKAELKLENHEGRIASLEGDMSSIRSSLSSLSSRISSLESRN